MRTSAFCALLLTATFLGNSLSAKPAAGPAVASAEKLQADGLALLRTWRPPVYPPAELKARHSGLVTVRLVVDETGRVTQARALEESDQAFIDSAVSVVKSWEFTPATEDQRPVSCCMDTLIAYSPAVGQEKASKTNIPPDNLTFTPAPRTSPEAKVTPSGDYPEILTERKLPGTVRFKCMVTTDGQARSPKITGTSHVDFILPALRALEKWEFQPAQQGDLAVPARIDGFVTFDSLAGKPGEILAANGITGPAGEPPVVAPAPGFMVDPIFPLEHLLAGEGGSATVDFRVTESGAVRDVQVHDATAPEYGQALAAAVESWGFERPIANNQATATALRAHVEFKAIAADAVNDADPVARVVGAMRRGEITNAKGLDAKLAPLFGLQPDYPATLKASGGPAGRAEIDIVIDREGRVRLPRVASATAPEFGWAAATAVTQWVFSPPRRGGEAVDVKVRIPFDFAAVTN